MKGLLFYLERALGRSPTKQDKNHARAELEFFVRKFSRGHRVGKFTYPGQRFRRPFREKKKEEVGDRVVVGRTSRIKSGDED